MTPCAHGLAGAAAAVHYNGGAACGTNSAAEVRGGPHKANPSLLDGGWHYGTHCSRIHCPLGPA